MRANINYSKRGILCGLIVLYYFLFSFLFVGVNVYPEGNIYQITESELSELESLTLSLETRLTQSQTRTQRILQRLTNSQESLSNLSMRFEEFKELSSELRNEDEKLLKVQAMTMELQRTEINELTKRNSKMLILIIILSVSLLVMVIGGLYIMFKR